MRKILIVALALSASLGYGQQKETDKYEQYRPILENGSKVQKDSLANELLKRAKTTKNESELEFANNFLYRLGQQDSADSLRSVIAKKFPKGVTARGVYIQDVFTNRRGQKQKRKVINTSLKLGRWIKRQAIMWPMTM